jgi:hypothetical protein
MKTAIGLLAGWLLAALLLLAHDGRLPEYLAGAIAGSVMILGIASLVRRQRAPSRYNQPVLPERYLVADDLRRPLAEVVAMAEQEAITAPAEPRQVPMEPDTPQQLISLAGDNPCRSGRELHRCVCSAAWKWPTGSSVTPNGASWPHARSTWDLLLKRRARPGAAGQQHKGELGRARGSPGIAAPVGATDLGCGQVGGWLSSPAPIVAV